MKILAAIVAPSLALLTAFSVCLVPARATAQELGPDRPPAGGLVQVSAAEAASLSIGRVYLMSGWPHCPPLPAAVLFGTSRAGQLGWGLLGSSVASTNLASPPALLLFGIATGNPC